jgi:hypothetical protein
MSTVLLVMGILLGIVILFAAYRYSKLKNQNRKLNDLQFERIRPLYEKLKSGKTVDPHEVLPLAANVLTRKQTFLLLSSHDRMDIFPEQYNTLLKGAESELACWLEYPTELDACPDEMEHVKRVSFDFDGKGNCVHYEVFKYRTNEPHWAAKDGWILGVVGPYFDDSQPYHRAGATFSRISSTVDTISPDDEARWVHDNISMK